jgi:hypothetical protein
VRSTAYVTDIKISRSTTRKTHVIFFRVVLVKYLINVYLAIHVDTIMSQGASAVHCYVTATVGLGTQHCHNILLRIPLTRYLAGHKRTVRKTNDCAW